MRFSHVMAAMIGALCLIAAPAHAEIFRRTAGDITDALQNIFDLRPSDTTNWRIGVGPYVAPAFEGSKDYKIHAAPVVSVRYRDILTVDNNDVDFTAFDKVFDFGETVGKANLDAGPVINLDFGRSQGDSPALKGLGNVGFSLEVGGFVSLAVGPVKVSLEISQDTLNGHKGADADLQAAFTLYRDSDIAVGAATTLTWASAAYMKSFFGVTGAQSLASGLPQFRAGSGLKSADLSVHATYDFARHWSLLGTIDYKRLLGDAAASPLVKLRGSANQLTGGTFIVYVF